MDDILRHFNAAKKKYDRNLDATAEIKQVAFLCLQKMHDLYQTSNSIWSGPGGKSYRIYWSVVNPDHKSRPFLATEYLNAAGFADQWDILLRSADRNNKKFSLPAEQVTKILYNTIVPFCVCFDIWKPKSRKTPGTFFEIVLGTLISCILPLDVKRTKHIPLPDRVVQEVANVTEAGNFGSLVEVPEAEISIGAEADILLAAAETEAADDNADAEELVDMQKVATDIVYDFNGKGIVIPAKITTRERIVQPFAHQRILDGVFGAGRYISLLICVSETQRSDKDMKVNDICVPGTITLFQKHLAQMGGIYYLDPPARYTALGRAGILPIGPLGELLTSGLARLVMQLNSTPPALHL